MPVELQALPSLEGYLAVTEQSPAKIKIEPGSYGKTIQDLLPVRGILGLAHSLVHRELLTNSTIGRSWNFVYALQHKEFDYDI